MENDSLDMENDSCVITAEGNPAKGNTYPPRSCQKLSKKSHRLYCCPSSGVRNNDGSVKSMDGCGYSDTCDKWGRAGGKRSKKSRMSRAKRSKKSRKTRAKRSKKSRKTVRRR